MRGRRETSAEDAREAFKYMKRNGFGADSSEFYIGWARFEAAEGNADKARDILQKAMERSSGVDQSALREALESVTHGTDWGLGSRTDLPRPVAGDVLSILRSAHAPRRQMPTFALDLPDPTVSLSLPKPPASRITSALTLEQDDTVVLSRLKEVDTAPHSKKARPKDSGFVSETSSETNDTVVIPRRALAPRGPSLAKKPRLGLSRLGLSQGPARRVTSSEEAGESQALLHEHSSEQDDSKSATIKTLATSASSLPVADSPEGTDASSTQSTRVIDPSEAEGAELDDTVMCAELQCLNLTAIQEDEEGNAALGAVKASHAASGMHTASQATPSRRSIATTPKQGRVPLACMTPSLPPPLGVLAATPTARGGLTTPKVSATILAAHDTLRSQIAPTVNLKKEKFPSTPTATVSKLSYSVAKTPSREREVMLVNGVPYSKLELLGKGGTSKVFRVLSPDGKILALKQARYPSPAAHQTRTSHRRTKLALIRLMAQHNTIRRPNLARYPIPSARSTGGTILPSLYV